MALGDSASGCWCTKLLLPIPRSFGSLGRTHGARSHWQEHGLRYLNEVPVQADKTLCLPGSVLALGGFPAYQPHLAGLKNNEVLISEISGARGVSWRNSLCCFRPRSFGISNVQGLQKVHSLLLLQNKTQFCILCTVSVYTLAYTQCRVFFRARKEFFKVCFQNNAEICNAALGHSLKTFHFSGF